jgi:hypothetical protein
MITPGSPKNTRQQTIELQQQDARLTLAILSPPACTWQIIDTARPRNEWDSPNPGTRMIAFEAVAPASGELTLAVLATPGICPQSVKDRLELRPLDAWDR